MSDQYTPTTVEVRFAYTDRRDFDSQIGLGEGPGDEEAGAEFDRWLASVRAEAREGGLRDGWDEGAKAARNEDFLADDFQETPNPYRETGTT